MTTTTAAAPVPVVEQPWPADVLELARRKDVERYLEPLRQSARELFPTGSLRVYFSQDPEIDELQQIVFEMTVPQGGHSRIRAGCASLGYRGFADLPTGTSPRVFSLLKPSDFEECFVSWMNAVCKACDLQCIHIDGKTMRGSRYTDEDGELVRGLHLVSAWAGANHMTLGPCSSCWPSAARRPAVHGWSKGEAKAP